jgi:hypothetical protein
MIHNLIKNSFQMTILELKKKKSSNLIIFLIIIKTLYGHSHIFDLLTTLFTVIFLICIGLDIDKNNNIIDNVFAKNTAMLGFITWFIGNTSVISKNPNIPNMLSNLFKSTIKILTVPEINEAI